MTVFSDIAKLIDAGYSVEDAFRKTAGYETSISTNTTNIALKANLAGDNVFTGTQQYAAGEGVVFNGDSITAANTLDDYEEGTFTPTVSDGTNLLTLDIATGIYRKIGATVFIEGRVRSSSLGSASGQLYINNLPFVRSGGQYSAVYCHYGAGLNVTAGHNITGWIQNGASSVYLLSWRLSTGVGGVDDVLWSANGEVMFSGQYITG